MESKRMTPLIIRISAGQLSTVIMNGMCIIEPKNGGRKLKRQWLTIQKQEKSIYTGSTIPKSQ
jgi:hypothetical protein